MGGIQATLLVAAATDPIASRGSSAGDIDPAVVLAPERFFVGGEDNGHLAFGTVPHLCLGMMPARSKLNEALVRLVQWTLRVSVEERPLLRRADGLRLRGLESLPDRFDS